MFFASFVKQKDIFRAGVNISMQKQGGGVMAKKLHTDKVKLALFDSLTLKAKYESGWSEWRSRSGALYVFKHLAESDKKKAPVAQCYRNRKYFSGMFRTDKAGEFSGDMLDKATRKKTFLIFSFEADKARIFQRLNGGNSA